MKYVDESYKVEIEKLMILNKWNNPNLFSDDEEEGLDIYN